MKFKKRQDSMQSKNTQEASPFFTRLISKICPCLNKPKKRLKYEVHEQTRTHVDKERSSKEVLMFEPKREQVISRDDQIKVDQKTRKAHLFLPLQEKIHTNSQFNKMRNQVQTKWTNYPVSTLNQNQILIIGKSKSKLLCILTTVCLEPSDNAKKMTKKSKLSQKIITKESQLYLDKYWEKRYELFQKFDQGIFINDNCWPIIIPQAVSDYVCSKIRCETVLNLQSGVGGEAIKLANTCGKVIAMDQNENNIKCLEINSKVYVTQNLKAFVQPYQFKKQLEPQITLISLYTKLQQECLNNDLTPISIMKPGVDSIIKKAMSVSRNLVIILPANIDVGQLSSFISEYIIEKNVYSQTCLIQIQKIFYKSQLKYVVVYFGTFLQTQITIDDELQFIYRRLRFDSKLAVWYKKIIKKLRQVFGMVKLLNIILQLDSKKEGLTIQNLQKYLRQNNLMNEQKIKRIFEQIKKLDSQEAKQNNQNEINMGQFGQRTISSISIGTFINNRHSLQNKLNDLQYDPYKSAPLNRQSLWGNLRPHSTANLEIPSPVNEGCESRESFAVKYTKQPLHSQQKQ